jgi:hypothetical protein
LGFVEGYLDCWKNSGLSGTVFSPNAARYADRLSQWYGIKSDDPGAIRPDRASRKIADVLHELKD